MRTSGKITYRKLQAVVTTRTESAVLLEFPGKLPGKHWIPRAALRTDSDLKLQTAKRNDEIEIHVADWKMEQLESDADGW